MKKFYAIIGNPPYQEETTQKEPTSNGQKPVKSIFKRALLLFSWVMVHC